MFFWEIKMKCYFYQCYIYWYFISQCFSFCLFLLLSSCMPPPIKKNLYISKSHLTKIIYGAGPFLAVSSDYCTKSPACFPSISKICKFLPKFSNILLFFNIPPLFFLFSEKLHTCTYFLE